MTNYLGPHKFSLPKSKRPLPAVLQDPFPGKLSIIAVDPGGTTGWSLLTLPKEVDGQCIWTTSQEVLLANQIQWIHGQIDCRHDKEHYGVQQLKELINLYPSAAVLFEGFQLRQLAVDLSPVKIIARVEEYLYWRQRSMITQMPAVKATANNARLKEWQVYTPDGGLDHARDADRHLMIFIRRLLEGGGRKNRELRCAAWPSIYQ